MRIVFIVFYFVLALNASAKEPDCQSLKRFFSSQVENKDKLNRKFTELNRRVKNDHACAKNLLGRIYFEGKNINQDVERAHAIFFELAEKAYPPAQYNLAFVLSKNPEIEPEVVLSLLQALIIRYTGSYDYGHIALKARDLGRVYLSQLNHDKQEIWSQTFENLVRASIIDAATKITNNTKARNRKEDNIMGMLSMGMLAIGVYGPFISNTLESKLKFSLDDNSPSKQYDSIKPRAYATSPKESNYLYLIPRKQ